jgi:hypothetical protein
MKLWVFSVIFILLLMIGFLGLKILSKESKTVNLEFFKKNISDCNLLLDNQSKQTCYLEVAKISKDGNTCKLIQDVNARGDCYLLAETG